MSFATITPNDSLAEGSYDEDVAHANKAKGRIASIPAEEQVQRVVIVFPFTKKAM
jgi:hypothetical protein